MKKLKFGLFVAILSVTLFACKNSKNATGAEVEEQEGIIALKECPQKVDGLSVELSQNEEFVQTIKITKDGKLLQELKGNGEDAFYEGIPAVFKNSMVYYVDANYDGYLDIYIGTGDDRTCNTLLLWNPDKDIFERYGKLGEPSLTVPYFSPSEKAIYESGSGGFFDYGYSKLIWKDGTLVNQENLYEILFREGFDFDSYNEANDAKRSTKYALLDSNDKPIVETNEINELPNKWAEMVTKFKASWGESSGDFPTIEKLKEHEAKRLDESIKEQLVKLVNDHEGWEVLSSPSSLYNFHKEENGMYKAEYSIETNEEIIYYELRNIEVDKNGKVIGLENKTLYGKPKDTKPDGGIVTTEEMVDKITGRKRY